MDFLQSVTGAVFTDICYIGRNITGFVGFFKFIKALAVESFVAFPARECIGKDAKLGRFSNGFGKMKQMQIIKAFYFENFSFI